MSNANEETARELWSKCVESNDNLNTVIVDKARFIRDASQFLRAKDEAVAELRADHERAMKVLNLNSHYDSMEDACRQIMQAYITEHDNSEAAATAQSSLAHAVLAEIETLSVGTSVGLAVRHRAENVLRDLFTRLGVEVEKPSECETKG